MFPLKLQAWLAMAAVALVVGCTPPSQPINPGRSVSSARILASLPSGAPSSEVTRVSVTLTAPDLTARTTELVRSGETWSGAFSDLPVGTSRTFSAEAFDSRELKRFVGRAENLSVTVGQELVVNLALQSVDGDAALEASLNHRPVLTGLTASPSRVDVSETTTLTALVSDPDNGDTLTYQWSTTGCSGRLQDATSASARFTPDALPSGNACGSCRLSVLATDRHGAQARGSLGLCVGPLPSVGFAPRVVDTDITDTTVGRDQVVQLNVRAWDPQGSPLTFSWELNVGSLQGSPTNTETTSTAVWVVPACLPEAPQPPRVTVSNALGQTATALFPVTYDNLPNCNHWASTGSMARPRQGHTATLLPNGQVLVTGGTDGTQVLDSAELYDPTSGTWTQVAPMSTPRVGHTATLLDNEQVLVVGGDSATAPLTTATTAELYDARTGQWSPVASLDTRRAWHTATRLSWGGVLITGGRNDDHPISNTELFYPSSGTWAYQGDMLAFRHQHTATLLPDNTVLVTGGTGTGSNTAEFYDAMTGQFTFTAGTMSLPRSRHTATLLPSGKVLIVGGDTGSESTASVELYDPATSSFTPASSLAEARAGHTATLLANRKVLIVGGTRGGAPLASTELYDPVTGLWAPARTMLSARDGHTTLLLGTELVLVTGGTTASGPSATSELYTP